MNGALARGLGNTCTRTRVQTALAHAHSCCVTSTWLTAQLDQVANINCQQTSTINEEHSCDRLSWISKTGYPFLFITITLLIVSRLSLIARWC